MWSRGISYGILSYMIIQGGSARERTNPTINK